MILEVIKKQKKQKKKKQSLYFYFLEIQVLVILFPPPALGLTIKKLWPYKRKGMYHQRKSTNSAMYGAGNHFHFIFLVLP